MFTRPASPGARHDDPFLSSFGGRTRTRMWCSRGGVNVTPGFDANTRRYRNAIRGAPSDGLPAAENASPGRARTTNARARRATPGTQSLLGGSPIQWCRQDSIRTCRSSASASIGASSIRGRNSTRSRAAAQSTEVLIVVGVGLITLRARVFVLLVDGSRHLADARRASDECRVDARSRCASRAPSSSVSAAP